MKPNWDFGVASADGGYWDDDGKFVRVVVWDGNVLDDLPEPEGRDFEDPKDPDR